MAETQGITLDTLKKALGLISTQSGQQVPLKSISVETCIQGFVADVVASLEYHNDGADPIEAIFVFPMDEASAVYHFQAEIGGRTIIGEVQTKEDAHQTYQDAMEHGDTAMLMEEAEHTSDILRCLVGNLPGHTSATIRFSYVIELPLEADGGVKFVLPTILNPRYNPSPEDGGVTSNSSGGTPAPPGGVPYTLSFHASILGTKAVTHVQADPDLLKSDIQQSHTKVDLVKPFLFDRDLEFIWYYDQPSLPSVTVEMGDSQKDGIMKEHVMMLNLYPDLDAAENKKGEFIFVVDRSGSMGGSRIDQASETLLYFLKSLPVGCCFNVISFGSDHSSLFNKSQEYDKKSLDKALELQKNMAANMGGTEILKPLKHIMDQKLLPDQPRQIFLLTDGSVTHTKDVIDLIHNNRDKARVFTFGIGSGASSELVRGAARAGRGKAEFISDTGNLQAKVMRSLKCALEFSYTDVQLEWHLQDPIDVTQVPKELPPVFRGEKLIVYALVKGQVEGGIQGKVTLKAKKMSEDLSYETKFNTENSTPSEGSSATFPLHRLAAKALIKELEDGTSMYGSYQTKPDISSQLTLLSTASNVLSHVTAFVAVNKNTKERITNKLQTTIDISASCQSPPRNVLKRRRFAPTHPLMTSKSGSSLTSLASIKNSHLSKWRCIQLCQGTTKKMKKGKPEPVKMGTSLSTTPLTTDGEAGSADDVDHAYVSSDDETYADSDNDQGTAVDKGDTQDGSYQKLQDSADRGDTKDGSYQKLQDSGPCTVRDWVELQNVDGSWSLDSQLASGLNKTLQEMKRAVPPQCTGDEWATALVICWLNHSAPSEKESWVLIEEKALVWLKQALEGDTSKGTIEQLQAKARAFLGY